VGVRADLFGEIFRGLRSRLDEVGNAESREAGDGARDENAIHDLEYANVRGRSLGLRHHFVVHLDFGIGNCSCGSIP
jgi:hypothetical protein